MKSIVALMVVLATLYCSVASAEVSCPRAAGAHALGSPFPSSENWYGGEALAVQLPRDGTRRMCVISSTCVALHTAAAAVELRRWAQRLRSSHARS